MKILLRIIVAILLLPGFIFDFCFGLSFIMNDGRPDHHQGDHIGQWAFNQANSLPDFLILPFMLTVYICALPVGLLLIALGFGLLFGVGYCVLCTVGAILKFPFTGEWDWTLPD